MSKHKVQSLLCPGELVTEQQLETDKNLLAFERSIPHLSRRGFLGSLSAAAAIAAIGGGSRAEAQAAKVAITDVLNFALNLEYLEANFYLFASTGSGLAGSDIGTGGIVPTSPPIGIAFDAFTLSVIKALAQDEKNHVELLRSAIVGLGGTPIDQPAINFAAKGAITTQAQYISAARQFTALGGSAYAGSAQLLVSNASVLTTAAQILGAEGQHAGAISYLCQTQGIQSPLIDAQDVPPSATNAFTVLPTTALSPARNTSQVLGVAYGVSTPTTTTPTAGVTVGGFFPNGVNGNVKST